MAEPDRIPISFLRECFTREPETDALFWRERPLSHFKHELARKRCNTRFAGKRAGYINAQGYVAIYLTYNGALSQTRGHRIVFALEHGHWPPDEVDHRNGKRSENFISNLRQATPAEQRQNTRLQKNNSSGFTGVHFFKRDQNWQSYIKVDGRRIHLGYFDTPEEAHYAYLEAKRKYHQFQPVPR
jgi:HNH endonuclease/AP2 domain